MKKNVDENKKMYYVFREMMKSDLINKDNFDMALVLATNTKSAEELVILMLIREDGSYNHIPQLLKNNTQFMLKVCKSCPKIYNEVYLENKQLFTAMLLDMEDTSTLMNSKNVKIEVKHEASKVLGLHI